MRKAIEKLRYQLEQLRLAYLNGGDHKRLKESCKWRLEKVKICEMNLGIIEGGEWLGSRRTGLLLVTDRLERHLMDLTMLFNLREDLNSETLEILQAMEETIFGKIITKGNEPTN